MRRLAALILPLLAAFAHAQTSVSIHDIMVTVANPVVGTAATKTLPYSPYYGTNVSVTGIVVGVESTGDYTGTVYISEPSSSWDSNVLTAEGMPVFNVASINSACAVVGANVTVVGTVVLSTAIVPADVTAAGTPGTGILPTSCTTSSTGTMTQSISLGTTLTSFGGALRYTGMTTSATFYAISPSGGTANAGTGTVTSNGQFWATLSNNTTTNNHLFRSAGIAGDEYYPSGSTAPTWAGNPQRILIDTTTFGGSPTDITVGQTITCATGSNIKVGATAGIGLIDYTLGYARLLIFPTSVCTVGGTVAGTTSAAADSTHFKVGTLDLSAFASTNPNFSTRLSKAAIAIVSNLGAPDILSLQEVSDLATLTSLSTAVNTLGGTSYVPYLVSGGTSTNVGFLVKSSTLTTDSVGLAPGALAATYTTSAGASAALWDAPPLVLKAEFVRIGKNYPVTVINPLMTLRDNSGDATLGADIRLRRAAQASFVSQLVQQYQTAGQNVVVAGNLNAFEYNDGYVDVTGIIDGSPATAVSTYQATSTTAKLADLNTAVTALQRYNFIERGDAVTYEHILASATVPDPNTAAASLSSYATSYTQPHFSTDFSAINANSATTPAGLTPHDGFVVAFLIPPVPTTASITPSSINFGAIDLGASSTPMSATVTNTTTFVSTINVTNIAISGTNAADFTQTSNCTSLTQGSSCTVTVTFTPTANGARNAVLTVLNDSTSDPTLTATLAGNGLDTTATLSPTAVTFASTYISATSPVTTFTYTNTSQIAETVTGASTSGDFKLVTNTCSVVAAGGTCTVTVDFAPTAAGSRTGSLTVTDSSTGNPILTSALSGVGLDTTATLTPVAATFPATDVTATSPATTFTFTNTSTVALNVTSASLTGDFAISANTCTAAIPGGGTCTISVTFSPKATGARTGILTVVNSSTGNPTLTATLNGTGLDTTASINPTSANFPATDVTGTSAAQVFTITNTSTVAISVTKLALTGDFTQTATTCSLTGTLPAGNSCTVSVAFVPTVAGARTGSLTVTNSSTANPTLVATLSGTGLDTTATLTPASYDFGSIYAGGGVSTGHVFTVTNTSTVAILVKTVTVSGNFTETTTCGGSLAAGATCTVSVVFAPLSAGALGGTLTVTNSSTGNPVLTASLTGTGLPTTATLSPASANYGNVIVGQTSAGQMFVWTNTSAIPLTVASVTINGAFAVTANTCSGSVPAGGFCLVTVNFKPTGLGVATGTVTVTSTSSANPTLTSTLTGRGVADVQADVSALNFGNVDIGYTSPTQTFNITNYTAASVSLTGITITGDYLFSTTCGPILGSLGNCTVTVAFTPTALGGRAGTVTVTTNDTKVPVIVVALTGNGVDFAISINPTSGATLAGYTISPTLSLSPLGGFASTVGVGCTTTASGSTCNAQTASLTLASTTSVPLTITTTSKYTVIGYGGFGVLGQSTWLWLAGFATSLLLLLNRRRKLLPRLAAILVVLGFLGTASMGCGTQDPNLNNNPTLPGTYTYTVSATDGKITHTASYSLTISIRY